MTDVDFDRAKSVAADLPSAKALQTGQELIDDPEVDAIVVASWGPTHEEYVLASIAAGKQVFCEKPLATTREACERILDAEVASGKRHVMVGFMRRYDEGYRAMKAAIDGGEIGAPLMFHSGHRNPRVPGHYTSDMIINDTCVHDVDVARFLLDDEIVAARVLTAAEELAGQRPPDRPGAVHLRDGGRRAGRRRGVDQHPVRLRHPRRGRRRERHGRAGRDQHGRGQEGRPVRRPGARGLARAVHPRLRHGVPGVDRRGVEGRVDGAVVVGRLRRHGGVRGRPAGDGERRAGGDLAARAAGPVQGPTARRTPTGTD